MRCVTVSRGKGVVLQALLIDRYAKWRSYFVLPTVTFPDAASHVKVDGASVLLAKQLQYVLRHFYQATWFLLQRQYLLCEKDVLVVNSQMRATQQKVRANVQHICKGQCPRGASSTSSRPLPRPSLAPQPTRHIKGEHGTIQAQSWLDNVWDIALVRRGIDVGPYAGVGFSLLLLLFLVAAAAALVAGSAADMLLQVKVATVGDSPQLAPAQRGEVIFNISSCPGVMGHLARPVVAEAQVLVLDPVLPQPCKAILTPTLILHRGILWVGEILKFQKLELPRAKQKVGRVYLVAKRLSDLADAERNPLSKGLDDLGKIYVRTLRGLWPQVHRIVVLYGFRGAKGCSEEHVEVLERRP